jgi:hypothetical protein
VSERTDRLLASEGWGGVNAMQQKMPESVAQSRVAEIAGRIFRTDEGKVLLEHLVAMTIDRPMLPAAVVAQQPVTSAEVVPYVAFREGQNAIVEHVLGLIRRANR